MSNLSKRTLPLLAAALGLLLTISAAAVERITYYHLDALGSPVSASDATGNYYLWRETYQPYGERIQKSPSAAANTRWYTGHPQDPETGLVYAGARYYDPVIGRFMAVDPANFTEKNPHSFNRYAYGNNNPYRYIDSDGNSPVDIVFFAYDVGKLGVALYTGQGVGAALLDVAQSAIGVAVPIPGAGEALKAARAVDRVVDAARETVGGLRAAGQKDAHHIIQDAAVRDLPGYNTNAAPGIQLAGPSNVAGTPHNLATAVQRQAGGGTYAAERRIGYKAMRRAGISEPDARARIQQADEYFQSIGVGPSTSTRIPGNR
jgi:RHS repeat-associated protein